MSDVAKNVESTPGGITGKGFLPGQSGNPTGRPKGFSHLIREQTKEGAELVAFALSILRGRQAKADLKLRLEALEWLADRGWGKAIQSTEISGPDGRAIILKGYQTVSPDDWPANEATSDVRS